jgi:phosphatidate cytidylyltransferase
MNQKLASYSNLSQRIIAAIFGVTIIVSAVYYSSWTYILLFAIIGAFTQFEFYKLLGLDGNLPLSFYGTFCGVFLNVLTFLIEKNDLPVRDYYLISPLMALIFLIKLYKPNDSKPFMNIAFTFLGMIYVALPFSILTIIALPNQQYSYQIVLGCLFLLWASDTGAYFAGTKFGKTKLFERVSPKKSWEGSLGGFLFAMLVAYLLGLYFNDLEPWRWYVIGGIIVVAGTYGDLVESLFKRRISIKDSGSTIPGHGGFLDRFDGLLLAVPFIIAFTKMF